MGSGYGGPMPKQPAKTTAATSGRNETKPGQFQLALIAASAGGIPALQDFLGRLPKGFSDPDPDRAPSDGSKIKYVHSSANPLFESAAYALDGRVVAIVLTGSGTDGTNGVQTVKGMGGVVLVREPASSAYSSMPLSAIGTGAVDRVLPLESIPAELMRLVAKPKRARRAVAAEEKVTPVVAEVV